jgi:hypothetical protein
MNRTDLIRHLESHGCVFVREGKKHTIYKNPANGQFFSRPAAPGHQEVSGGQNLQ